jgi:glucosamine-6-phosphate deaminase
VDVRVFASEEQAASSLADRIAAAISARPQLVLALPTGRSPLGFYRALIERHRAGLDLAQVRTFNLDEWVGVPAEDPASFRAYMERHLFSQVNLVHPRVQFLEGMAEDLETECARFDAAIAEAGGIDLAVLGLGVNGHIAFNEPGDALIARTHRAKLTRETRLANAGVFGGDAARVPLEALTMGMAAILQAREIALLAFGESKALAVRQLRDGPVTPRCPASFLQLHPRVTLYLDEAAATP